MPKYRVLLKGVRENSPEGRQAFLSKFAAGFKVSEETALDRVRRPGGLITAYDDEATAKKAADFLNRIGGVAAVESDQPAAPAPTATPDAPPGFETAGGSGYETAYQPSAPASAEPEVRPCPKCGYAVPVKQDECPSCHVFISKYQAMLERKAQAAGQPPPPGPAPALTSAAAMYGPQPGAVFATPTHIGKETVPEARTAVILGLVGLLFPLAGIWAISNGFKAAKMIGQNPDQLQGMGMAYVGVILGFINMLEIVVGIALQSLSFLP